MTSPTPPTRTWPPLSDLTAFKFCSWDGDPAVWTPGEAWVLCEGSWSRVNSAWVGHEARPLSKAAFDAKFGSLPPLPKTAFHSGGNLAPRKAEQLKKALPLAITDMPTGSANDN